MNKKPLILVGSRQNMEIILEIADLNGYEVVGILDRFYVGKTIESIGVIGSDLDLAEPNEQLKQLIQTHDFFVVTFVTGTSNNPDPSQNTVLLKQQRMALVKQARCQLANLVHPDSYISKTARLGGNLFAAAHTYIESHVCIGDFCTLMYGVGIGHHTTIGNNCTFQGDAGTAGSITVGNNVIVGVNTRLLDKAAGPITVGDNVVLGPSLTVMKDIPSDTVVYPNGKMVKNTEFFPEDFYTPGIVPGFRKIA